MILRRVQVSGFRCFTSEVTLNLDPNAINVLTGRNGSGKSSLLWATIRGLLDTHKAGGAAVKSLQPWGTDLGPTVVIEFEHDGKPYRLAKKFLHQKGATLEQVQGRRFTPLAKDEKAEERVREMLLSESPTTGLTKPDRWGLVRVLWSPQDQLRVEGFDGRVMSSIQDLLGNQGANADTLVLSSAIEKAFSEYWTDKGKPKGGQNTPQWVKCEGEIQRLTDELAKAEDELEQFSAAQEAARTLEAERDTAQRRFAETQESLTLWQGKADEYRPLVEKCERVKAQWESTQSKAIELQRRISQVAELERKKQTATARKADIEQTIPLLRATEEDGRKALADADRLLKELQSRGDDTEVRELETEIQQADSFNQARMALGTTASKLDRAHQVIEELRQFKAAFAKLQAPDKSTLTKLEDLAGQQLRIQTQLQSALLYFELRTTSDAHIEVAEGEPPGRHQLKAGSVIKVSGSPTIEVTIEGVGVARATGPSQSAETLRGQAKQIAGQIEKLVGSLGTTDLGVLRQRREDADTLESKISVAEGLLKSILEEASSESLEAEVLRLRSQVGAIEAQHPEWRESPPDLQELKRRTTTVNGKNRKRLTDATSQWQELQRQLAGAKEVRVSAEQEREQLDKTAADAASQLLKLRTDGLTDQERSEHLAKLSVEAVGLGEKHKEEQGRLKKLGEDPAPMLQRAQKDRDTANNSFQRAQTALDQHRGNLKWLIEQAPYERQAKLAEQREQSRGEAERDKLNADALKLLRETIHECEEEATAGVSGPVAERATALLRRIAGKRFGEVRLDDTLGPLGIDSRDADADVDLQVLSGGEQEQVHLAIRLALAELLTKEADRRELVVLDDVLTATDDERLARVLGILDEMKKHAQFLILTSHPERYKSLKGANFIDMEKLRSYGN